jgi:hypothetical protein
MAELGFIIPLNLNDYLSFSGKPPGDRTNWCTAHPSTLMGQPFYTNDNLRLSGSSLGPTSAKVGDTVRIQVGVQGVNVGTDGATVEDQILHVQAWICYPNTVAGRAGPLVASMKTGPTPAKDLTASPQKIFGTGEVLDYQNPVQPPGPVYAQFTLDNPWKPQQADIIPPNVHAHCCIMATCQGLADVNNPTGPVPVGLFVPGTDLSQIDICSEPHEAQRNISILPITHGMIRRGTLLGDFGFLSGGVAGEERARVVVEVMPLAQPDRINPVILGVLQAGPWSGLPLRAARSGPRRLVLHKNPHLFEGWLATIISDAEEFIEDPDGRRVTLALPPNGLQPMLLQMELDESEAPGTVHVFDIVQTDPSGRRGGIRVGAVVVP